MEDLAGHFILCKGAAVCVCTHVICNCTSLLITVCSHHDDSGAGVHEGYVLFGKL